MQNLTAAQNAQEDASYYAWMVQRCRNEDDDAGARFFQEEAAYFAEIARNAQGLHDAA